jgi:hypothetical protein
MENEKQVQVIPEYDFDIIEIIKAGWAQINGVKAQFVIAMIIYIVATLIVQVILGMVFPTGTTEAPNYLNQQIVGILSYPVLMPLIIGIMMMAIHHTRGESINFKSIFNYYHLTGILSLAGISVYLMTILGLILLIIPGIYLSIAYVFTLPLIVDKKMGVWEAMEHSRKSVTKHWFKVFGLTFLLSLIMLISAIPLGAGLVWTLPLMFVTLYGLLYPVMFDQ